MEDETKAGNVAEQSPETVEVSSRVLEDESPIDSVVKPVVGELTQTVESLVQNVVDHSSSYVAEKLALISDSWTSLGKSKPVQESSDAVKSAPAEQENSDLDEHSRAIQYSAVTAEPRASWTNCCGLLDVLRPSDH